MTATLTPAEITALLNQLNTGTTDARAAAADKLATAEEAINPEWVITIYDKLWRPIGAVGDDLMELSGTDPRNRRPSNPETKRQLTTNRRADELPIHHGRVTVETQGIRLAFYVDGFDYDYQDGAWTGVANLKSIWDILNFLQIWPMWFMPIQAQPISHAIYVWALQTVIETIVVEQAMRIQIGLNEFINNALSLNPDIRAWFGTLLQSGLNLFEALKTPIYVTRTNPLLDTSPMVARTVRMESCATVIIDISRAYGVDVRVDLWLPGDPQPDIWAFLTHPTYVVSPVTAPKSRPHKDGDRLGVTHRRRPWRRFRELFAPMIQKVPGMDGVVHAPRTGVNFVPPWTVIVAPENGEKGAVITTKITDHTPKGWQVLIGGRSPKWLNDLMNATFAWIIDSISILIGFTGIPSDLLSDS